ncbi:MAG: hypothetical protein OK449_06025 [Thaumarchaeota archaeon]|nr:hypothetical protein [Nitrososphaerota archaeon]
MKNVHKTHSGERLASLATIAIVPLSGNVGTTVSISGSGLAKGKRYEILFNDRKVGVFAATAGGGTPAGLKFVVPETPTTGKKGEMGTKLPVEVVTKAAKDGNAEGSFELQASITIDTASAYLGQSVHATAAGLLPNATYQLVMLSTAFHAFPAGILDSDSKGSGATTFVVPGYLGPALYRVDLMHKMDGYPTMQLPPPLPVIGYSPNALIAGAPKSAELPARPGVILIPFRNTTTTTLMPMVYAIIYTTKKQPLQITSSVVSLPPKSTRDSLLSFAHLPKGKYAITVFATTGSGHIVSKMFSFPLTI